MSTVGAKLYRYRLGLRAPLRLGTLEVTHRAGLLLALVDTEGDVLGWGDCAPLPGFSEETLAEAEVQLRAWVDEGGASEVSDALLPSVRFAVQMAKRQAENPRKSLAKLLSDNAAERIAINALIDSRVLPNSGSGFAAVKLKVARRPLVEEVAQVQRLRAQVGPSVPIIADANRGWELGEACAFAEAVKEFDLLYVEEPLKDPSRLGEVPLPVALDETLLECEAEALPSYENIVGYVLKPTLLGGLDRAWGFGEQAVARGLQVTVSGAFESGVGTWQLACLAAAIPGGRNFAGLDTYSRLAEDVLSSRLSLAQNQIEVDRSLAQIDETQLECIAHG